jgi:hypothetical protein
MQSITAFMKYLSILFILFHVSTVSYGQKLSPREKMERYKDDLEDVRENFKGPYVNFIIQGGSLYPTLRPYLKNTIPYNNLSYSEVLLAHLGIEIAFDWKEKHLYPSLGFLVGGSGFKAKNSIVEYQAGAWDASANIGINYTHSPKKKNSFITATHFGGLARSSRKPGAFADITVGYRFLRRLNICVGSMYITPFEARKSDGANYLDFNILAVFGEIKISLRNKEADDWD